MYNDKGHFQKWPFLFARTFAGMNYEETIDYLFTRLPMFSRIGAAAYKADLTNTIRLCAELGNPQEKFRTIHIAGTNGKGSVSHMLAAIFQTAGYKTGLYTSPHLKDFRERIKINGEMADKDFVVDFTQSIRPLIEEIEPSFFEITVGMAFSYFAKEEVDIAIIETGLGGRLDSTNIIVPELSLITNIGMDHMNMLGDTLEKIATEKAGIIKKQVPVIIGEHHPETDAVFIKKAQHEQAAILFAQDKYTVSSYEWEKHLLHVKVDNKNETTKQSFQLDLPGIYQTKNLLSVLLACDQLRLKGWKISDRNILDALPKVKKLTGLHGRWELLRQNPMLVVDVAHNEDGMSQLVAQIKATPHKVLHIVLGMVKDKEVDQVLSLLPKNARYYFTRAEIPRALPEDELMEKANRFGLEGKTFANVNFAMVSASLSATKDDLIVVCGSIFLVGEVSLSAVNAIWKQEAQNSHAIDMLEAAIFFN